MLWLREKYALYVHIFIIIILNRINLINSVLHIIIRKHYVKLRAKRNFLGMYLLFDLLPCTQCRNKPIRSIVFFPDFPRYQLPYLISTNFLAGNRHLIRDLAYYQ